ncbi:3-isopropylmalate dehydrogenase [Mycobacterium xenopi 4042]|uniref:3-isopropylmalate dehydrogenase n=1 Tax=Mycobacterium xenopi 4042 TaxID=1299334 RepID=X7Z4U0_MYCXE|nr:3-isopropylmalate dehydrogenase [Mycobacterium xenopi 4042]
MQSKAMKRSGAIETGDYPRGRDRPEVVTEAVKVLDAVLPDVEKTSYDLGARRFHATGEVLPDSVLDELRAHDAILLGAIGDPSVPSGVLERGLLLRLRFELDHHINLRPARRYPGVIGPLSGNPRSTWSWCARAPRPLHRYRGAIRVGTAHEVATEVSVNTAFGFAGSCTTRSSARGCGANT